MIRVPLNQIIIKHTAGGELMYPTNVEYKGYYYEFNNNIYAGKEYKPNAPILIKINSDKLSKLLQDSGTYVYGRLSQINIQNQEIKSYQFNDKDKIRYFAKKLNTGVIKEINKEEFINTKDNPLYTSIELSYNSGFNQAELDKAELKISGIKQFISSSYVPQGND